MVQYKKLNENSSNLWHKRLEHISKQIIHRHMSEGILGSLDLSKFQVCIQCTKGKQTNKKNFHAERANDVL